MNAPILPMGWQWHNVVSRNGYWKKYYSNSGSYQTVRHFWCVHNFFSWRRALELTLCRLSGSLTWFMSHQWEWLSLMPWLA